MDSSRGGEFPRNSKPDSCWIDIHCHCLPGLDDGPATLREALVLCRSLAADRIRTAVATVHQLGRHEGTNGPGRIKETLRELKHALEARGIPLELLAGADVRLDERLPRLVEEGEVLTLAGTRYLLLELPHEIFVEPLRVIVDLAAAGIRTVVSHPERHIYLVRHPETVLPWLEHGAFLQLTAGSFLGRFGPSAERAAWHWIENGQALLVATDAHNVRRRPPLMSAAAEAISRRFGAQTAERVCKENPARLLADSETLLPLP